MGGARAWPMVPALVAAGAVMLLAITASAFTGSPNPVVWAERAGSTLQSVGHSAEPAPNPEPSSQTQHSAPVAPAQQSTHEPDSEATDTPEPKETPEPRERPELPEAASRSGDQ